MPEFSQKNKDIRSTLVKYAANILSRRPYFYGQLKNKLLQRSQKLGIESPENDIQSILQDLQVSGYLNDSYLAEAFVRRHLGKGHGPKIIKYKLIQLGLSSTEATAALSTPENIELVEVAKAKIASKYSNSEPFMVKSKLYQRGF